MPILIQIPPRTARPWTARCSHAAPPARPVTHIALERGGRTQWCVVASMDASGTPVPATACLNDDSGDGAYCLVVGGSWDLRLDAAGLDDARQ